MSASSYGRAGVGMSEGAEGAMSRRRFLELASRAAGAGAAASFLHLRTAYAEQAVDCPIYFFHISASATIERVLRTAAREGRRAVTVGQLTTSSSGRQTFRTRPSFA